MRTASWWDSAGQIVCIGGKDIVYLPRPAGLRIAVGGGGCSGFSYSMTFENSRGMLDQTYNSDGFEVLSGKYMSI